MVNKVILIGNMTRDAETAVGPSTTVTRLRIATNSVWRDAEGNRQEHAEFHSVVAFGKLGEICATYCLKGRRVYIDGRLRTREYDGTDGLRRHTTEIVAETMKLLDRAPSDAGTTPADDAVGSDTAVGEPDAEPAGDATPSKSRGRASALVAAAS